MTLKTHNVFVGSGTGSFKGVVVGRDANCIRTICQNFVRNRLEISNKNEITCMEWCSEKIIVSFTDRVKLFNVSKSEFTDETKPLEGKICGIFENQGFVFAALTSGIIKSTKLFEQESEWVESLRVNGNCERMKRSSLVSDIIATGGKENDLKLWNVETGKLLFAGKNIKPDELQLQIPIWISDLIFSNRDETISTCSRHGYVRVYDPRLSQRRPVFNAHKPDEIFTCMSRTPNENQFLVGCSSGDILVADKRAKTPFLNKFKDSCGTVKAVACPDNSPLVFSVSLDRHFRIHDFNTRKLLHKDYMQSRLTSVLTRTPFIFEKFDDKRKKEDEDAGESDLELKKVKKEKKILHKIFSKMEKIVEKSDRNS